MERILHVNIDNNGGNGAFSLVSNLYEILKGVFIFDFYTMDTFLENDVYNKIVANGGICYSANLRTKKLIGHIRLPFDFYKFIKRNSYHTVHIHSEVAYKHFLYAIAAKKAGVSKIIIHSHSDSIDGGYKVIKKIFHMILKPIVNMTGTNFIACSKSAAEWMFTKKNIESNKFLILNNGVVVNKYRFDSTKRNEVRTQLGLTNKKVICHVGAFKWVKNQSFLLEIIKFLNESEYKLLLIGDGEDKKIIEKKANEEGLSDMVVFMGTRSDVEYVLNGVDIFVLPSFFEGIPMVLIEAQAMGIPVIASDVLNQDIKVNENVFFESLESGAEYWANIIMEKINKHIGLNGNENIKESCFNIVKSADLLKRVYLDEVN